MFAEQIRVLVAIAPQGLLYRAAFQVVALFGAYRYFTL